MRKLFAVLLLLLFPYVSYAGVNVHKALTLSNSVYIKYDDINQTNKTTIMALSCDDSETGTLIMCEKGDEGIDFGEGDHHNPRLRIVGNNFPANRESYITFNVNDNDNGNIGCGQDINILCGGDDYIFGTIIGEDPQKVHICDGGDDNEPGALALYADNGANFFMWADSTGNFRVGADYPTDDDTDGALLNQGYSLYGQATSSGATPLTANTDYYFGARAAAVGTTITTRRIYIPQAGTIKAAYIAGTSGVVSDYDMTVAIRLNDTTDYTVVSDFNLASYYDVAANSSLDIDVVAGDYITIKWTTGDWGGSGVTYNTFSAQIYVA